MGLLLSVLVVCIGVLEAISCARHVQHGYLPFWATSRMRPMTHERPRRKPNEDSSDDESADELTRILHNGGGVNINRAESPSYGLTPILTEHRRNTPILRDNEGDDDDDQELKYVPNNIDEPSYTGCCRDGLTERFRPISPPELDGPVDESYVSQTGKFLALPPDGDSPLQRSSSEETLHDSEIEDVCSPVVEAPCPVDEHDVAPDGVVFQIDNASPPVEVAGPEPLDDEEDLQIDDINDDSDLMNDPVYNLVSAAAYILSNDPPRTEHPSRTSPHGTTSSSRPLNLDLTARLPTPQSHRESIPFDLAAAHVQASTSSRPETPGTPPRKSRADISWPVFHPEPVIKRPIISHSELSRDVSIEEDDDLIPEPSHSLETEVYQPIEDECSKVFVKSLTDVPATPFVVIPGCRRIGSHKSLPESSSPPPPPCKTSYDRFGRITCTPHKGRFSKKRRGSLERPPIDGTLKDNVLSKSLPDFFFEEKAQSDAASKMAADDAKMVVDDENVSLGKDITPKESSIKRRRSYREKKRSTWTPNKSRGVEGVVAEPLSESETEEVKPKKSLFEIDNESLDEFVGSTDSVNKVGTEAEAIENSALSPVEVLHHAEVRPESAVFATSRQQPKTRLKKPIKAESFEEAPPSVEVTASRLDQIESANTTKTTLTLKSNLKSLPVETKDPPPPQTPPPTVDTPITSDATKPPRDSVAKPDETKANDDDEEDEEEEDDDISASQTDTSNINQPQQSSQPAPFWVRRQ